MGEDRDESEKSEAAADVLGNDEDTEKGEVRPPADEAAEAKADEAATKGEAKAEKAEAKAENAEAKADKADAKAENGDATDDADPDDERHAKPGVDDDDEKGDAAAKDEDDAAASSGKREATSKPPSKAKEKGGGSRWWLVLLVVLVAEFYVYGRRGDIEVCVGKADVHDFSLIGQERTDDNRWKFPRCEARVNLGLRSQYDELVEDGTSVACRGATLFRNRGEGPQCIAGSEGWSKQVQTSYIWPWDSRYYKHLLWFIFD
jgi:hypothetical protein